MRDQATYQRIQSFRFDEGHVALRFVNRLARENGWSLAFAERVVEEYRRFAYLAATGEHPMTPSDEVDQAWHLHMLYTESYFDRFCGEVLGKRLSHGPTKGGRAEGAKFTNWYAKTITAYAEEFGEQPPADIWPSSEVRFGRAPQMVRVDKSQVWILDKTRVRRTFGFPAIALVTLGAIGCVATTGAGGGDLNPLVFLIGGGSVAFIGLIFWLVKRFGSGQGGHSSSGCGGAYFGGGDTGSHRDHGGDSGDSDGGGGDSGCGSSGCGGGCGGGGD